MDKDTLVKCGNCDWVGKVEECPEAFVDLELNPAFGGVPSSEPKCPQCGSDKIEEKNQGGAI